MNPSTRTPHPRNMYLVQSRAVASHYRRVKHPRRMFSTCSFQKLKDIFNAITIALPEWTYVHPLVQAQSKSSVHGTQMCNTTSRRQMCEWLLLFALLESEIIRCRVVKRTDSTWSFQVIPCQNFPTVKRNRRNLSLLTRGSLFLFFFSFWVHCGSRSLYVTFLSSEFLSAVVCWLFLR
ncbi:hypothetical protein DFJ43DRAFT_628581 [Lentinula guzmanii]|uniref:Uncharacterized protein n=1 Tax=Lentinula guzmanii TaxID=2804957 RepID=A0AA38JVQ8_9AGAR|nr:hypothetical protein DFJ43DRAFT_628581 [Lentinula guzmanii]